jgi:hypothetical protein
MRRLAAVLLLALEISLAPGPDLRAVPVPCDCATCLLSPDRLCTEPETVRVWRCEDYTAARCPVHT